MISIYGASGFVGGQFCRLYPDETVAIPREQRAPKSSQVLYLISTTHNYHVFKNPYLDIETNLKVLIETLEACRQQGSFTFNFVSSWFVYGEATLPAKEGDACKPRGFYSITKLAAEQLVESYCQTHSIPYRIIRLSNVAGRGDKGAGKQKNALAFLIDRIKRHEPIELYHNGDFVRDYLHVKDVCRGLKLILDRAPTGEVFNLGSGKPTVFKELIEHAIKRVGSRSQVSAIEPPQFHKIVQVKDSYLNTEKVNALGFRPKLGVEDIVEELLDS